MAGEGKGKQIASDDRDPPPGLSGAAPAPSSSASAAARSASPMKRPYRAPRNNSSSRRDAKAAKTSWDNGFASLLSSDSWKPFLKLCVTSQNAAVDIWNNSTTQTESSRDNAWGKQAGGGGLDAGGSSWGGGAVNKDSEKSGNWGEACKQVDTATGGDTDPWGRQDEAWGKPKDSGAKSEETNNGTGNWNKAGSSDQVDGSDWGKPSFLAVLIHQAGTRRQLRDNQNSTWSRPAGNFEGGRGLGEAAGGRGRES
ncbi:hypothetical protein ZWY2020_044279 [Hordeum vulgare]|nr:hypothetical protein ZWY2020_044279 [Hordeum vulgare]